jgi:predicted nucleic acid-binding protein
MRVLVIDASVLWKLHFPESWSAECTQFMDQDVDLVAPLTLIDQIGVGLAKRVRMKEIEATTARDILRNVRRMPVHWVSGPALDAAALDVVSGSTRPFTDGQFLALAIRYQTKVVTADRKWYSLLTSGSLRDHVVFIQSVLGA